MKSDPIAARWKKLEPWAKIFLRDDFNSIRYEQLRNLHRERSLWLTSLGIEARIVAHNALDDPRLNESEFKQKVSATLNRQRGSYGKVSQEARGD